MRIDVTYAGGAHRVIETAGESVLSSSALASSPEWAGRAASACAVQMRVRTDLASDGSHGLAVEVCAWTTDGGAPSELADYGQRVQVPRLALRPFRVWEVLPADELARAVDVDVDGRIHLQRVAGRLLDLTAYERLEARVLSGAERGESALDQRVLLLHDRMRRMRPDLDDGGIGDLYGLGTALIDYALAMSGEVGCACAPPADDGLEAVAGAIASAITDGERVEAVADAIAADPSLTPSSLRRALGRRGLGDVDVDALWEGALDTAT